jgi:copper chaperone NosL
MPLRITAFLTALLLLGACETGPREITVGAEECSHCRMIVSEDRFAAQVRTEQGRTHVFDSIECLVEYVQDAERQQGEQFSGMWVSNFLDPGSWLEARQAYYLQSPELRSPMGLNLSAYATEGDLHAHRSEFGGEVFDWAGVLEVVASVRVAGGGSHAH